MWRTIEIIFFVILPITIGHGIGYKEAKANLEPQTIYKTVYKDKIVKVPVEKVVYRDKSIEEPLPIYTDTPEVIYRDKPVEKIVYKDRVQTKYIAIENNVPILELPWKVPADRAVKFARNSLGRLSEKQERQIREKFRDGKHHKISLALRVD